MNIDIKTADGEEVELGGMYYDEKGARYQVTGIKIPDHQSLGTSSLYCIKEESGPVFARPDSLYLTPPDSLERLLEDLGRGADALNYEACAYFGKSACDCSSCIADKGETCERVAMRDIASRIRKLRGEDE